MTAVAKSQLNPLADSFVPTMNRNGFKDKIFQHSTKSESKMKTVWQGSNQNSSSGDLMEYMKSEVSIMLDDRKNNAWSNISFSSITSVFSMFITNTRFLGQKRCCTTASSQLPLLPELPRNDSSLVVRSKVDLPEILKIPEGKAECSCPPMFGYIVPPEFTGNIFNFKYECRKKYPHSPNTVQRESDSHDEINRLTLDEYSSKMKNIVTDVCETISVHLDSTSDWDENNKNPDCEGSEFEDGESNELMCDRLYSISENETNSELIDDGYHPLLQSTPTREEDQKDLVQKVEKILEKSLSSSLLESRDSKTESHGAVCDPPCSVWCEFLPEAAKETFKKYIQKSRNTDFEVHNQFGFKHRPVYKRSLSADDAPMVGQFNEHLKEASTMDSREMLILRRKDPLNYFKIHSNGRINRKHGSFYLSGELFANSNVGESSMWGKFDGADSLWRPLPECMPENIHNSKTSGPKRGREARRQRSLD